MAENNPNSFVSVSLYVGDLDLDTTEAQLFEKFSTCGQVTLVKLCRDKVTRQSLGYAYVNFAQPADAERALDTLNFEPLNSKPMRIMWSNRDPALRRSGFGNVFIKNLDKSIDNKSLYDTFSTFGNIISCKIMADENGSKGYGFVHFETQEAADDAIKNVNEKILGGKIVYVGQFLPRQERSTASGESETTRKFTNVYVKNLEESVDDKGLEEMFKSFGEITSAIVSKNAEGKSLGFGFINFKNPEDAAKAVTEMHEKSVSESSEKKLYVSRFQKKTERSNDLKKKFEEKKQERMKKYYGINLFVKNLDDKFDDERLKKEFEPYGKITSAKVMNENGRSRGFGFVCFSAPEEAAKAVAELNGRIVGSKPLYVALAQRKDERKKILLAKFRERISSNQYFNQQYANRAGLVANQQQVVAAYAAYQNAVGNNGSVPYQTGRLIQQAYNQQQQQGAGIQNRNGNGSVPRWQNPNIYSQQQAAAAAAYYQGNSAAVAAAYQTAQRGVVSQQYQTPYTRGNYQPQQNKQQQMFQQQNYAGNRMNANQQQQFDANNNFLQQAAGKNDKVNKFKPSQNAKPANEQASIPGTAGQEPLNIADLLAAPPQLQKQLLGERLYQRINKQVPEMAGKITGMLLEIDNAELLHMLESEESLNAKIEEAVTVLNTHREKQQLQQAGK